MGVPGTDSETGLRLNTEGCIFWVDPNHPDPNDNRDGTNPNAPFATIGAALTHCEAYRGDVIAVMHNGFWTYADSTESHVTPITEAVTINVPGVRLVGISPSSLGVPWVPTADNQTLITVNELDVTIEGFNFWLNALYTGTTGISAAWNSPPYGENLTVRHCYFYALAYGIQLDYAWNCYIEDCGFNGIGTCAIHNPSVYGEPDYLVIRNCQFWENVADINLPDCDEVLIENNRFFLSDSAIVMTSGDYNQILNNTLLMGAGGTVAISMAGSHFNQIVGNTINGDPADSIVMTNGDHNILLNNAIEADPTGVNNMINMTGGASNLVGGNYLSCTIAQYDTTCSDATSGSWGGNHCSNGDTTAPPT